MSQVESSSADSIPTTPPQITPPSQIGYGHPEYQFVQAIMEMQKSLGEINASIISLRESVNSTKSKVDTLIEWKHKIIGGAFVLGAIISILSVIMVKGWDYVSFHTPAQQILPSPAPQPIPTPSKAQ